MNTALAVVHSVNDWMDVSDQPVYPQVMASLFPDTEERRPSRRAASRKATERFSKHVDDGMEDGIAVKEEEYNPDEEPDDDDGDDFLPSGDYMDIDTVMPPLPMSASMPMPPLPQAALPLVNTPDRASNICKPPASVQPSVAATSAKVQAESTEEPPKKKRTRRKSDTPAATKPTGPVIVDIRPLVEEVRAGRYPSMKVYNAEHLDICFLCKTKGDDVFNCEFCANSEHLGCLKSKVTIRDPEPEDEFMCHRCIQTVLARRARAEKRRLEKLNEAMKGSGGAEGNASGVSLEQAKNAAALKREVIWSQSEFDAHVATYSKCPTGGPGGLICCGPCTASYSRLLSETAKEMEGQTLSGVGREVSELVELLHDAQVRLKQAVDVSTGNEIRRSLLNRDQVDGKDDEYRVGNNSSLMGIIDIFSSK